MAFNVDDFRTNLVGDGARPNLFEVQFTNWPGYITVPTDAQRMSLLCNATTLPGSDLGMVPLQYFGREIKLAGNRTYPEWSVTVINDEDFYIRNIMENWTFGINSPVGNLRDPGAAVVDGGYGVDATVIQYGKDGSVIKQYQFLGMWPLTVAPIDLAWGSKDSIEEFTVTFAYQYWISDDPQSQQ
jgi:hypothetical protein